MSKELKITELGPRKLLIIKTVGQLRDNLAMAEAVGAKILEVRAEDLKLLLTFVSFV